MVRLVGCCGWKIFSVTLLSCNNSCSFGKGPMSWLWFSSSHTHTNMHHSKTLAKSAIWNIRNSSEWTLEPVIVPFADRFLVLVSNIPQKNLNRRKIINIGISHVFGWNNSFYYERTIFIGHIAFFVFNQCFYHACTSANSDQNYFCNYLVLIILDCKAKR